MKRKELARLTVGYMIDAFYPVGSVITNTNSNYNPNKVIGGEWIKLPDNVFLSTGTVLVTGKNNSFVIEIANLETISKTLTGGWHDSHWYSTRTYIDNPWGGWGPFAHSDKYVAPSSPEKTASGGRHTHHISFGHSNPTPINVTNVLNTYLTNIWVRVR